MSLLYSPYTLAVPRKTTAENESISSQSSPYGSPQLKKCRIESLSDTLQKGLSDVDIHLKAALYCVSKGENATAAEDLERVRRLLKGHQKKSRCLLQDINADVSVKKQQITTLKQRELHMHRRNLELETKVKQLEAVVSTMKEEKEFHDSNDDVFITIPDTPLSPSKLDLNAE